ncbi:N-formylglutamate amidohydrolase [soil metagenome]
MSHATFDIHGPAIPNSPVVLSVPHAGRDYPDVAGLLRHPVDQLRALEDRYVDHVANTAIAGGVNTIVSRYPRLWIDLNRAESDIDPAMVIGRYAKGLPTARMRGGLGLIPRRLGNIGEIWQTALTERDVAQRVEGHYRPYHAAISTMLARARARFGVALLVDLHSMPPLVGNDKPAIVLGDRFGMTCARRLTDVAGAIFEGAGFSVGRNAPYAGGHIISCHADRRNNIHALQIEIDRSLYLDSALDDVGSGLPKLQKAVGQLIGSLAAELTIPAAIAAE